MYADIRPPVPATAKTLPARFFTDPELFSRELEQIHLTSWLGAGRSAELDAPGRYLLATIDRESVIVLRDKDGELRAFHNLCRHRGTRLLTEPEGRLSGRLQCPYHGWTYGYDGCLRSAPLMDKNEGFVRDDYPLRPVAVAEWQGHAFVHLGKAPEPFASAFDDLPERLAPWPMAELRRVHRVVYTVAANWKLLIHNYSECIHCPLLHPQLQALSHHLSGDNDPPRRSYLGGRMELRPTAESLSADGTSLWAPIPGLAPEVRRRVGYYALLPNLLLNLHPQYLTTFLLWPRAHDHTEIICEWHFHPDEIARPDFAPEPAIESGIRPTVRIGRSASVPRRAWLRASTDPAPILTAKSCCGPSTATSSSGWAKPDRRRAGDQVSALARRIVRRAG